MELRRNRDGSAILSEAAIELAGKGAVPTTTQQDQETSPRIEIMPAALADAPILENLLHLYVHDFTEFRDLDIGEDGRFVYPPLPLYWSDPGRHPFLVKIDGKLAGLVLVKKMPGISRREIVDLEIPRDGAVWDMAEFFILRGCRRRGIGTQVAHEVWKRFPGAWEVRVMQANVPAQHFWTGAISRLVGEAIRPLAIEKDSEPWILFRFESPHVQ